MFGIECWVWPVHLISYLCNFVSPLWKKCVYSLKTHPNKIEGELIPDIDFVYKFTKITNNSTKIEFLTVYPRYDLFRMQLIQE